MMSKGKVAQFVIYGVLVRGGRLINCTFLPGSSELRSDILFWVDTRETSWALSRGKVHRSGRHPFSKACL